MRSKTVRRGGRCNCERKCTADALEMPAPIMQTCGAEGSDVAETCEMWESNSHSRSRSMRGWGCRTDWTRRAVVRPRDGEGGIESGTDHTQPWTQDAARHEDTDWQWHGTCMKWKSVEKPVAFVGTVRTSVPFLIKCIFSLLICDFFPALSRSLGATHASSLSSSPSSSPPSSRPSLSHSPALLASCTRWITRSAARACCSARCGSSVMGGAT